MYELSRMMKQVWWSRKVEKFQRGLFCRLIGNKTNGRAKAPNCSRNNILNSDPDQSQSCGEKKREIKKNNAVSSLGPLFIDE